MLGMNKLTSRQRTLAGALQFGGIGVHSGAPVTLTIERTGGKTETLQLQVPVRR